MPDIGSEKSLWLESAPLILASNSEGRRLVLEQTAIPFVTRPAKVDERKIEAEIAAKGGGPDDVVLALSCEKALTVSSLEPGAIVLGADQAASCAARLFGKPEDIEAAAGQLRFLGGRTHRLHSGYALARDGVLLAKGVAHAALDMRPLNEEFLLAYLAQVGEKALTSAGAYQVEGLGAHLFSAVRGDHWTIMGLPLLGVLEALRRAGALRG